jgi:hypothetical protein
MNPGRIGRQSPSLLEKLINVMDWVQPYYLVLALPLLLVLWWFQRRTLRPLSEGRRRALLLVRVAIVGLTLLALASPAWKMTTQQEAVIFVLDHSQSQGPEGMRTAREKTERLVERLDAGAYVGFLSAGDSTKVHAAPVRGGAVPELDEELPATDGGQTDPVGCSRQARRAGWCWSATANRRGETWRRPPAMPRCWGS